MTQYLYTRSGAALADDTELERVTAYTGGFMSDAERKEFERDFVHDEEFAHRVAPFLKIFYSRAPIAGAEAARARIAARRARRRAGMSETAVVAPTPAVTVPAPAATDAVVVDITPRIAERKNRRWRIQGFVGVAAAAALAVVLLQPQRAKPTSGTAKMAEQVTPPPTTVTTPPIGVPAVTPSHRPKPRVKQLAVVTPPPADLPIMSVTVDSIDPLPLPGFTPPKVPMFADPEGRPITIVVSPLDSADASAAQRIHDLLTPTIPVPDVTKRGWFHWPAIIGRLFGHGSGTTPPPKGH